MLQDLDWDSLALIARMNGSKAEVGELIEQLSSSYDFRSEVGVVMRAGFYETVRGGNSVSEYYKMALAGPPEWIDPVAFGLKYILEDKGGEIEPSPTFTQLRPPHVTNDVTDVARWVHETIVLVMHYYMRDEHLGSGTDIDNIRQVAYIMYYHIVGKEGLERIRTCLKLAVRKMVGETRYRVESFLKGIELVFENFDYFQEQFHHTFPRPRDVSYSYEAHVGMTLDEC